jgi:hypothetical protein
MLCQFGLLTSTAVAQQPLPLEVSKAAASTASPQPLEVTATPEMWFYDQERRRYDDPNAMARRRAEEQANQRQARLAAQRWFGISNSRPRAGTDPNNGSFAPRWVGNGQLPNEWVGTSGYTGSNINGIWLFDRVRP